MPKYVVLYQQQNLQRIEAESVTYDTEDQMFVFRDASKKPVAWAPRNDVRVVALAPVVDSP
ncbi:hypothetical protein AB0O20_06375 [Streptomyces kronopolitis]|uniref:hypothetical protein n=1 Tax=Streptomyces kronopolitis TaxID=1612435 RepID=UPI00343F0497